MGKKKTLNLRKMQLFYFPEVIFWHFSKNSKYAFHASL